MVYYTWQCLSVTPALTNQSTGQDASVSEMKPCWH
jgi:hypothetical protein